MPRKKKVLQKNSVLKRIRDFPSQHFSLVCCILFIIYCLLLLYNISSIPLFVGDERQYQESIYALMYGKIDSINQPLLAKTIGYFFASLFSAITGTDNPFFWRIGTILFSLGSLLLFYKILKFFFSRWVALCATILLAIDPMFFSFSRLLQLDIPMLFFFLGNIYYFFLFLEKKYNKYFFYSGLFIGLSLATKLSSLLTIPFLQVCILFYYLLAENKSRDTLIKASKISVFFLCMVIVGFILGNGLFFFKESPYNILSYTQDLISSQLTMPKDVGGHLSSPAWTWFVIPQILTLYRLNWENKMIETVIAFQNPLLFITTLFSLIVTIILLLKNKLAKRRYYLTLILFFISCYVPFFFNLHATYYYYILPLIPLVLILFFTLLSLLKKYQVLITVFLLVVSCVIFALYYPLLIGKKVPKPYEMLLFRYSSFTYPPKNDLFCHSCSPRK